MKNKKIFNMSYKKFFICLTIVIAAAIVLFSSLVNIYLYKDKITIYFKGETFDGRPTSGKSYSVNLTQVDLAKDIVEKGGYILYFRHGHREKWIDVAMYDAMEAIEELDANDLYFKDAVCLSKMGMVQVRMMGEFIRKINLPVGEIVTSPSCRARQTSEALFGTVGEINNLFLHPGPYNEDLDEFKKLVNKEILKLKVTKGKNSIVSAHNGIIKAGVFDKIQKDIIYDLEEGGFYVMKNINGKLVSIDKFHNFNYFLQILLKRPR